MSSPVAGYGRLSWSRIPGTAASGEACAPLCIRFTTWCRRSQFAPSRWLPSPSIEDGPRAVQGAFSVLAGTPGRTHRPDNRKRLICI